MNGKAYIIGTGPGDEELLTVKAIKVWLFNILLWKRTRCSLQNTRRNKWNDS